MTTRLLRMILWLYPTDFRRRFGAEMLDRANAILGGAGSAPARATRSIRIVGDALFSVPRAWRRADAARIAGGDSAPRRLVSDLAGAGRALRSRPGLALTVIGTLGLSIGVTTSLFSVVNGVLLRPLPFDDPGELVRVYQTNNEWDDHPSPMLRSFASRFPLSYPILRGWHEQQSSFDGIAGYAGGTFVHVADGEAALLEGQWTSANLLSVLGVEPEVGRLPGPEYDEVGQGPVVVLSHALWMQRFGQDPDVLARTITLDDVPYPIVGVAPADFAFNGRSGEGGDLWITFTDEHKTGPEDSQWIASIGRLRDGVTLEAARADLDAIQKRDGKTRRAWRRTHRHGS